MPTIYDAAYAAFFSSPTYCSARFQSASMDTWKGNAYIEVERIRYLPVFAAVWAIILTSIRSLFVFFGW